MTPRRPMAEGPLVIQTEELSPEAAAWLGERCRLEVCGVDDPRFGELVESAGGLIVRTYTTVDDALLDRAPKLRVVGRAGVSLANIDVEACRRRDVAVVHTPDSNTQAVVEYVLALALDATRPRVFLYEPVDLPNWRDIREEMITPRQLSDMTIGVWGVGRIGSRVSAVFRSIGSRVLGHDIRDVGDVQAEMVDRDTMLRESDLVTVHIDDRPANKAVMDAEALALLRDHAVVINASRGFVMDTDALADWLREHPAAQAVIDVHEPEPFGADYPLLDLENAHLSPHLASAAKTAKANMSWVVRDVWRVLQDEEPEFRALGQTGAGR
ncbi:MAG: NAD(P)-dependent oxidoreductase [Planctomycetota bacterium]